MSPYAVEFCQRYLDRHPDQTGQVIDILAQTDILTSHEHEKTLRRSRDIYESWLLDKDKAEHAIVAWAHIKVSAALGDKVQLDKLIEAAPLIDRKLQRVGAIKSGIAHMAVFYFKKGYGEEALRVADMAYAVYPGLDTANLKAMILEGSGRLEEARGLFLALLAKGVESPRVYESLARISHAMGDFKQSIEYQHMAVDRRAGA
jgi:tetratricopeptide (TPR) repeat protein